MIYLDYLLNRTNKMPTEKTTDVKFRYISKADEEAIWLVFAERPDQNFMFNRPQVEGITLFI